MPRHRCRNLAENIIRVESIYHDKRCAEGKTGQDPIFNLFISSILSAVLYGWERTAIAYDMRLWKDSGLKYCCMSIYGARWVGSRVKDVIVEYQKQKFCWARHIAKFTNNRETHVVFEWYLRDLKWPFRWPLQWWKDEIKQFGPV